MKKVLSLFIAAVIMLCTGITSEAAGTEFERCGVVSDYYYGTDHYINTQDSFEMTKNRSIKNSALLVNENEKLIITNSATLYLYNGAEISGAVYIADGARVCVLGGKLALNSGGSLFVDGTLTVNKKCSFTAEAGSQFFVGKPGTFRAGSSKSVDFKQFSDIICLGTTNVVNSQIGTKAIAAYITNEQGVKPSADPEKHLTDGTDYDYRQAAGYRASDEKISFIFDNGACVTAVKYKGLFISWGNISLTDIGAILFYDDHYDDPDADFLSGTYIYTIGDKDYTFDYGVGYEEVLVDNDFNVTSADDFSESDELMKSSLKNLKNLERIRSSAVSKKTRSLMNSPDLFKLPDGHILVIDKYKDASPDVSSMARTAYILAPIK